MVARKIMDHQRIIIIGGGIGGLTSALALQQRGFKVVVCERTPAFREIGAGLIVTANARRALRALGVDADLEAVSSSVSIRNTCNYATGEIIQEISNDEIERRFGFANLQVHRGDLHNLLLDAVRANDPNALHPAHEFVSLKQNNSGVTVHFADGSSDWGDAVIGADGNASAVRSFLFPGEATEFNGQVAYRALIPDELVTPAIRQLQMAMHPAPKRYLLLYPLRRGRILNLIGCGQAANWEEEGWAIPATNEEFANAYADFAPELTALIRSIPTGALFKWGLRDREPLKTWIAGRVAMLGDAAHPMTPFLGQGACIAIEDALVLGRAFEASVTVEEALQRYERARKTRGTNVQLWSREEGQALQDPAKPRRTAIDRGLLHYDPVSVPV
jgi:2-polyprenyl-6-methoxyphenol hydroxylase-like FAD-dependent oxidoreductase